MGTLLDDEREFLRMPRGRTDDECDGVRAGGEWGWSTCILDSRNGESEWWKGKR